MAHLRLSALTAALVLGALAAPATAHADDPIAGRWRFETAAIDNGVCVIRGDIDFTPATGALSHTCAFVSVQECGSGANTWFYKVAQSCKVQTSGDDYVITSKVEKILDVGPDELREPYLRNPSYRPDHFRIHPSKQNEMTGIFYSGIVAGVRFWREEEKLS